MDRKKLYLLHHLLLVGADQIMRFTKRLVDRTAERYSFILERFDIQRCCLDVTSVKHDQVITSYGVNHRSVIRQYQNELTKPPHVFAKFK